MIHSEEAAACVLRRVQFQIMKFCLHSGNLVRKIIKDYTLMQHELYVIPLTLQTRNPFWQLEFCAFVAALVWYSLIERACLAGDARFDFLN